MPPSIRSVFTPRVRRFTSLLDKSTTRFSIQQLCKYRCRQNPSRPAFKELTTLASSAKPERILTKHNWENSIVI